MSQGMSPQTGLGGPLSLTSESPSFAEGMVDIRSLLKDRWGSSFPQVKVILRFAAVTL
jgi:hypothetical protein